MFALDLKEPMPLLQVSRAEVPEVEPIESYVIVQKEDVLEAIGTFVAAYLAELPEAQNLQPAQLQAALKHAFKVPRQCKQMDNAFDLIDVEIGKD